MINPVLVCVSPNRENIKYVVKTACDLEPTFEPLAEEIRRDRSKTGKVIIFCRSYNDCSHVYLFLKSKLGAERLEPVGAPDMAPFRLVDMFTACTHPAVKNDILESFCVADGILRVVVATVAFGMGLDCPNVRKVGPLGTFK